MFINRSKQYVHSSLVHSGASKNYQKNSFLLPNKVPKFRFVIVNGDHISESEVGITRKCWYHAWSCMHIGVMITTSQLWHHWPVGHKWRKLQPVHQLHGLFQPCPTSSKGTRGCSVFIAGLESLAYEWITPWKKWHLKIIAYVPKMF